MDTDGNGRLSRNESRWTHVVVAILGGLRVLGRTFHLPKTRGSVAERSGGTLAKCFSARKFSIVCVCDTFRENADARLRARLHDQRHLSD